MSGSGPARELNRSRMAEAALQNEYLTRERVTELERKVLNLHGRLQRVEGPVDRFAFKVGSIREFWGRLRWLLLGR